MGVQIEAEPEVKISTLVGGIAEDAQRLVLEQLKLFQVEIKNDVHRGVQALIPLFAGMMVVTSAMVLLGAGAAYGVSETWPQLPLWAAFAIVGGGIGLAGMGLIIWGAAVLNSIKLTPDKALEGLKENLQWKTKN